MVIDFDGKSTFGILEHQYKIFQETSMMTLISNTAKEHKRIMDVAPRYLDNFGILEEVVIGTYDRLENQAYFKP